MKHRAVFITATDTGVGKTIVTALLLAHLRRRRFRAVAMKPFSSGDRNDARLLRAVADNGVPLDAINPIHFKNPVAPYVAERLERRTWKTSSIHSAFRALRSTFSPILIEGIGGLLVPLHKRYSVCDLVCDMKLPLVIVARPGLGTLNHTALTIKVAREAGVKVLGIVLNDAAGKPHGIAERSNFSAIEEVCRVKVLAHIPHIPRFWLAANSIRDALKNATLAREVAKLATVLDTSRASR